MKKRLTAPPKKTSDLPATRGMLTAVDRAIMNNFRGLNHEMNKQFKQVDARFKEVDARFNEVDARFNEVDARFNEVDARFNEVDARFNKVDARFDRVDAKLEEIKAEVSKVLEFVSRTAIEHEAQRGENRIVYENMHGLYERQERIEGRADHMDQTLKVLARKKA